MSDINFSVGWFVHREYLVKEDFFKMRRIKPKGVNHGDGVENNGKDEWKLYQKNYEVERYKRKKEKRWRKKERERPID